MRVSAKRLGWIPVLALSLGCTHAGAIEGQRADVQANPRAVAVKEFMDRVDAYMKLRDDVAKKFPPPEETKDAAKIVARQKAFAEGIRAARAGVKRGDIFTPQVEPQFRRIVDADFDKRPKRDEKAVVKDVSDDPVRVNAEYPTDEPMPTTPPKILAALQPLPKGLEYRFMKRHLILYDVEANLIVDYVPNVLPPEPVPSKSR